MADTASVPRRRGRKKPGLAGPGFGSLLFAYPRLRHFAAATDHQRQPAAGHDQGGGGLGDGVL